MYLLFIWLDSNLFNAGDSNPITCCCMFIGRYCGPVCKGLEILQRPNAAPM